MTISVALATCNGSPYLREQLQSFLNQTRQPDELVISDDASDDDTLQLARSVLSEAPFPVRVEANPKRFGVAANFSKALGYCRGDIVALSDQDDVWFPHKLQCIETMFHRHLDLGVIINDAVITDVALRPTGRTRIGQTRRGGYSLDLFVQGSCTSLRGSLLQHALPVPSHLWTHDKWIHAVAQLLGIRVVLGEPLQYFRRHGNNESTSPTSSLAPLTTWRSVGNKLRRNLVHPPSRHSMIDEQLARAHSVLAWWEENSPHLAGLPYVNADRAAANAERLRRKADVAQNRIGVIQRSRVRRLADLAPLYVRTGGESYGGTAELIKDLVIR